MSSAILGSSNRNQEIVYPDSDGKPMAENTLQFEIIVSWKENVSAYLRGNPNVFIAGGLLWYPVEGHPEICTAPDLMVAFGRPKGYRGSYKQFEEENIPPQVVAEILSPNNTAKEMANKLKFYERYGVQEYFVYDPDREELRLYLRFEDALKEVEEPRNWVSPLLGIRFNWVDGSWRVFGPDGKRFQTMEEIIAQRDRLEKDRESSDQRMKEMIRLKAEAEARAERMAAKLRELGIEPE